MLVSSIVYLPASAAFAFAAIVAAAATVDAAAATAGAAAAALTSACWTLIGQWVGFLQATVLEMAKLS